MSLLVAQVEARSRLSLTQPLSVARSRPSDYEQTKGMIMSTHELPRVDTKLNAIYADLLKGQPLAALLATARSLRQYLARQIHQRALRSAEAALMALDDRMLRDIGLSRGEIGSAVRHGR